MVVALTLCVLLGAGLALLTRGNRETAAAQLSRPEDCHAKSACACRQPKASDPSRPVVQDPAQRPSRPSTLTLIEARSRLPAAGVEVRLTWGQAQDTTSKLFTSDAEGYVTLPPEIGGGFVEIVSEGWAISSTLPSLRFAYAIPNKRNESIDLKQDNAPVISLRRVKQIHISAGYADHIPYRGIVTLRRESGTALQFDIDGEWTGWCDGEVPSLSLHVPSIRPGYANATAQVRLEHFDNSVRAILAEAPAESGVIVADLGAFPENVPVIWGVRRVLGITEEPAHFGPAALAPTKRSTGLLAPGDYRVYAYQHVDASATPRLQWRSETVRLKAGETSLVVAAPELSSGVRARLVSTAGEAICPGALRMAAPTYLSWPHELKRSPSIADGTSNENGFSDKSGYVLCAGLWAGTVDLQAEAPGYEIATRQVQLMPGQVLDLGVIVLSRATGTIEIAVTSEISNEEGEYEVLLLEPGGLAVSERFRFKGPKFRIEHLPLREYAISVNDVSEQTGDWSKHVRLTGESPHATVTFEMKRPPLPPRKG